MENKPVHSIKQGNIHVSIWANPSPYGGLFYNIIPSRSYLDEDQWRNVYSFGEFDLAILSKLLLDAHTFILDQKTSNDDVIRLPVVKEEKNEMVAAGPPGEQHPS